MEKKGTIYSFEPNFATYEKTKGNIDSLIGQHNITVVNKGVSNKSGKLNFREGKGNAGGSRIDTDGSITIDVTTIDEFCETFSKMDFIKMDVEGAECDALYGSKHTIIKHRPHMAICVYHKYDDLWNVPRIILSFDNMYKCYLRHNSRKRTETVMYFVPCNEVQQATTLSIYEINPLRDLYNSVRKQLQSRGVASEIKTKVIS